MKRIAAGLAIVLCFVPLLFGNGQQGTEATQKQVTITKWTYPLMDNMVEMLYEPLIEKFHQDHPNIDVEIEVLPWAGRDQKMLSAVASGSPPDIAYFNEFYLQMFAKRGALLPLEDYIPESVFKERYSEGVLSMVTFQDHIYLAPTLLSTVSPIYHTGILEAAGLDPEKLPETWDELLEMAEAVKKYAAESGNDDLYPICYSPNMDSTLNMTLYPLIWQAGGDIITEDFTKAAFDSAPGKEAMNFVKTLFEKGYSRTSLITDGEDVHTTRFVSGQVACLFHSGQAAVSKLRNLDPNVDQYAKVGPILKNVKQVTYGTVGAWAMFKNAKHPKEAAVWIDFLTSPEINYEFNLTTGYMSPIMGAPPAFADDPLLSVFEQHKVYARPGLTVKSERKLMDVIKVEQQNVVLGEKTVDQALADAEEQVNVILQND